jgi:hypothetical protein
LTPPCFTLRAAGSGGSFFRRLDFPSSVQHRVWVALGCPGALNGALTIERSQLGLSPMSRKHRSAQLTAQFNECFLCPRQFTFERVALGDDAGEGAPPQREVGDEQATTPVRLRSSTCARIRSS